MPMFYLVTISLNLNSMIFRFVRDEQEKEKIDPSNISEKDYGNILAKKYYDKLYKEFAIVDLSRY